MQYEFETKVVLLCERNEGEEKSRLLGVQMNLDTSNNLDVSQYLDHEGLPNKDGSKVMTQCLVHALIGNIHQSHQKGFRDSAEHLREIIETLEKGFADATVKVVKSKFKT